MSRSDTESSSEGRRAEALGLHYEGRLRGLGVDRQIMWPMAYPMNHLDQHNIQAH